MGPLNEAIGDFADFLLEYFVVLASAGALAMALVELYKKLRDARTRFHASAVTNWFVTMGGSTKVEAFGELLHLAAGVPLNEATEHARSLICHKGRLRQGHVLRVLMWPEMTPLNAAFALDLERMAVCFQDSADLALTAPTRYANLYEFVTAAADPRDRSDWAKDASQPRGPNPPTPDEMKDRAERYARLRQAAKRKLDTFQMFTGMRWVNQQQFWANVLGTVILGAAFYVVGVKPEDLGFAVAFSLLGGVLAPIAKDIVVALQQVRQPRAMPPQTF